jgi:hypothetical protein
MKEEFEVWMELDKFESEQQKKKLIKIRSTAGTPSKRSQNTWLVDLH